MNIAACDLVALFSDGLTEETRNGEEFGEHRLIEELTEHRSLPVEEIVPRVFRCALQSARAPNPTA